MVVVAQRLVPRDLGIEPGRLERLLVIDGVGPGVRS